MYDTSRSLDIITDIHDTAMHKAVRKVLGGADKIVGVQMPYTPRCLRFTQDVKLAVWDSIKWKMEESICEARSKADKTCAAAPAAAQFLGAILRPTLSCLLYTSPSPRDS